jgi:hypothetical protein
MRRFGLALFGAALGGLIWASVAPAAHHLVRIREVFPGSTLKGANAEYIELQLTAAGENQFTAFGTTTVRFYDNAGAPTNSQTFAMDPPNPQNQRSVLVATPTAQTAFGVTPDLTFSADTNSLNPLGGAACWDSQFFGPLDCVSWGNFTGSPISPTGTAASAITDESSLTRSIAAGCPTLFELGDDTNNSATDFANATPTPRNNAATPDEVGCPSLFVSRLGSGSGTVTGTGISCPSDCSESYMSGTPVALTATPAAGSMFGGFSANCPPGSPNSCVISMTASTTVTATFDTIAPAPTPIAPVKKKPKKCKKPKKHSAAATKKCKKK